MFFTVILAIAALIALFILIVYLFTKARTKNRKNVDSTQATRF